jgi:hypothetical protein
MNDAMLHGVVNNLNTLFDWYGDDTDYSLLPGVPNGANANVPYAKAFRWTSNADKQTLLEALGSGANFYWWGHGLPREIFPGYSHPLESTEIAAYLENTNGLHAKHPYNLVILDCCHGYSKYLANAFGMSFDKKGNNYTKDNYQNILKRDPQAFVGWTTEITGPNSAYVDGIHWLEHCQGLLFSRWQEGFELRECIQLFVAELKQNPAFTGTVPSNPSLIGIDQWKISGCYDLTTSDR